MTCISSLPAWVAGHDVPAIGLGEFVDEFERLRRDVVRHLRARGADGHDAEDCVQAALLELWSAVCAGRHPRDSHAWTSVVAWRRLVDLHRDRKRFRGLGCREVEPAGADEVVPDRQLAAWLVQRLAELPATSQQVCHLLGEGRTPREVAAALDLTPRAVESHLTRVRRFLRAQMALGWACCTAAAAALVRMAKSIGPAGGPVALAAATCVGVVALAPGEVHTDPAAPVVAEKPAGFVPRATPASVPESAAVPVSEETLRVEPPVTDLPVSPQPRVQELTPEVGLEEQVLGDPRARVPKTHDIAVDRLDARLGDLTAVLGG